MIDGYRHPVMMNVQDDCPAWPSGLSQDAYTQATREIAGRSAKSVRRIDEVRCNSSTDIAATPVILREKARRGDQKQHENRTHVFLP